MAAVNKAVGVQQAHHALDEDRLAGAGFAYDGQAFSLIDIQADPADGVEHLVAKGEFYVQILYRQNDILI